MRRTSVLCVELPAIYRFALAQPERLRDYQSVQDPPLARSGGLPGRAPASEHSASSLMQATPVPPSKSIRP